MSRAHAKLSPSASKRWMTCPGSIRLCQQCPPQKDSVYSAEGTAAHELAETCLKKGMDAAKYVGECFNNFTVTEDMAEAVQVYLDAVRAVEGQRKVEVKFDMSWLYPGMFGSNDASVYDSKNKTLHVFDYKHGQRIEVDPEWNSQLMIYALGAMYELAIALKAAGRPAEQMVEKVVLVIVQPRAIGDNEPVKRWEISGEALLAWGINVLKPCAAETEKKDAKLLTGDHCRFCPAIAICPEQIRNACAVAKTTFDNIHLPSPDNLSPDEIAKIMEASEVFSTWAKEVTAYAQSRAEIGVSIPGYKLVQKRSNRVWRDSVEAAYELEQALGENAFERSLISPAQAEKLAKKNKIYIELERLWEKPEAGLTLVPETDKRAAVNPPAALTFIETADFLQ